MRFCPFCSAENADEQAACTACGRRLPPLPPRRAGSKGQPTGIIVPPRPQTSTNPPPVPARSKGSTLPPPTPVAGLTPPPVLDSSAVRRDPTGNTVPSVNRDSAPALPPPPAVVPGGMDTIPS